MRALILRRGNLLQAGVGGIVLIGPSHSAGVVRLQGFLTRNGQPHHLLDPERDRDAAEVIARATSVSLGLRSTAPSGVTTSGQSSDFGE